MIHNLPFLKGKSALYLSDVFIWDDGISLLIDTMRVTQFFLDISWISTCVSLFHPVFFKSLLFNRNPSMTMSKKKTSCSTNEDYPRLPERFKSHGRMMVWQIPSSPKSQMVLSEIQGLSIFVNDQEAELDDWNDKTRRTWNSLSWLSRIHDTFFSETCWFVHSSESWILGFRLKVGSSNAFGMEVRSGRLQALMDFIRIQDFLKQSETWNRQNPAQITFFLKPILFWIKGDVSNEKTGSWVALGCIEGVHFGYVWDHHSEWETVWSKQCIYLHESFTPAKTNMTMEHPPWMKMYVLLEMGIFQKIILVFRGVLQMNPQNQCRHPPTTSARHKKAQHRKSGKPSSTGKKVFGWV